MASFSRTSSRVILWALSVMWSAALSTSVADAKPPSEAERLSLEQRARARADAAAEKAQNRFNCWRDTHSPSPRITCRSRSLPAAANWEDTAFGNFSEDVGTQEKEIESMPGDVTFSLPESCPYDRLPTFGSRCTELFARFNKEVRKRSRAELKAEQKTSALLYDLERVAQGKRPLCYDIKNVIHAEIYGAQGDARPDLGEDFAQFLATPPDASCDGLHGNRVPIVAREGQDVPSPDELRQEEEARKKRELDALRRALVEDPLKADCRPCGERGGIDARIESCQTEMEDLARRKAAVGRKTYTWTLVSCTEDEDGKKSSVWRDDEPDGGLWSDVISRAKYSEVIQFKNEDALRLENLSRPARTRRGFSAGPELSYAIYPVITYSICADNDNAASLESRGRLRTENWTVPTQADAVNAMRHGILQVLPNLANTEIWLGDPHYFYADKAWRLAGSVGRILMTDKSDGDPYVRCFAPFKKLDLSGETGEERRRKVGWDK